MKKRIVSLLLASALLSALMGRLRWHRNRCKRRFLRCSGGI